MGWAVYALTCSACGHQQVSVVPLPKRPPVECAACGEMAAE